MKLLASSVLLATVLAGAPAFAEPYLALGDSIAFGFNPFIDYTQANIDAGDFISYPQWVAQDARYAHLELTNAGCPGETSGSFIDASKPDNGCHSTLSNQAGSPHHRALHTNYGGSQLNFALNFLRQHPDTRLVTINLGGNDLLLVQDHCGGNAWCEAFGVPGAISTFTANLTDILWSLRSHGYHGDIVVLTQYAGNYGDTMQMIGLNSLSAAATSVAAMFGAHVARGLEVMEATAQTEGQKDLCRTNLVLHDAHGTCNVHPSRQGAWVLSQAVLQALGH